MQVERSYPSDRELPPSGYSIIASITESAPGRQSVDFSTSAVQSSYISNANLDELYRRIQTRTSDKRPGLHRVDQLEANRGEVVYSVSFYDVFDDFTGDSKLMQIPNAVLEDVITAIEEVTGGSPTNIRFNVYRELF